MSAAPLSWLPGSHVLAQAREALAEYESAQRGYAIVARYLPEVDPAPAATRFAAAALMVIATAFALVNAIDIGP